MHIDENKNLYKIFRKKIHKHGQKRNILFDIIATYYQDPTQK